MARTSETRPGNVSTEQDVSQPPDIPTRSGGARNEPRRAVFFLIAAVAATAVAGIAVDRFGQTFQLPDELTAQIGISPELQARFESGELSGGEVMGLGMAEQDPELQLKVNEANRLTYVRNAALSWAIVGLLAAAVFGCAAGCARRSLPHVLLGLFAGTALGAGLGAAAGWAAVWTEDLLARSTNLDPMVRTMGMHAAGWAIIGIAVGIAVGMATRAADTLQSVAAAVVGAVISAVVFSLTAAVLFSGDNADLPVPEGTGNRVLWAGLGTVLMALMLSRVSAAEKKPATTES